MLSADTILLKLAPPVLPVLPSAVAKATGVKFMSFSGYSAQNPSCNIKKRAFPQTVALAGGEQAVIFENELLRKKTDCYNAIKMVLALAAGPHNSSNLSQLDAEITAYLPLLNICGVQNALELKKLCNLPLEAAKIRMLELTAYRKNMPALSSTDNKIIERYLPFIWGNAKQSMALTQADPKRIIQDME